MFRKGLFSFCSSAGILSTPADFPFFSDATDDIYNNRYNPRVIQAGDTSVWYMSKSSNAMWQSSHVDVAVNI